MMKPDALVRIRLFNAVSEGQRVHSPIVGKQFSCPVFFDAESGYDTRIYLAEDQLPLSPGNEVTVPIKFLYAENVRRFLRPGVTFRLWESGFFAEGEVISVTTDDSTTG